MNTTFTALDDRFLATIAGGTNGQTTMGFELLPVGPGPVILPPGGQFFGGGRLDETRRGPIGPCPNPDAFPIGPCPNPDANG